MGVGKESCQCTTHHTGRDTRGGREGTCPARAPVATPSPRARAWTEEGVEPLRLDLGVSQAAPPHVAGADTLNHTACCRTLIA